MKKFKYFSAVMLLAFTACKTNADNPVTWQANGHVANTAGTQKQLDITGVYDSLNYQEATYLAGFKIDKYGTNIPQLVRVNTELSHIDYWAFEKIPNDIFVMEQKVHVIDSDGGIHRLEKGAWALIPTTFPPESQVVYSNNNADVIICYPASPLKSNVRASGCKSFSNNWRLDFVWLTQVPKVCAGKLYVVEELKGSERLNKVDIKTGKIISSSNFNKKSNDLCKL